MLTLTVCSQPLDVGILKKKGSTYSPEQIHIAFAGPGGMFFDWR